MNYFTSKNVSIAFGTTFLAAGVLGFFPNPLVAADGVFEVNFMHNLLHIVTSGLFFLGASRPEHIARATLQGLGIVAVALAVLGFLAESNLLLGLVHVNHADKWLHAGFALVIVGAGFGLPKVLSSESVSA